MDEQNNKEGYLSYIASISGNLKTIIESIAVIVGLGIALPKFFGEYEKTIMIVIVTVVSFVITALFFSFLIRKSREKIGWYEEQLKTYEKEIDEIKKNSNLHILNIQTHLKQIKTDESVNKVIGKSSKKYIERELEEISNSVATNINAAKINIVETRKRMKELMASKNKAN
jgi:hypothetical protein